MTTELGAISHMFSTFIADVFTILLFSVGSHVTFCVLFVFVLVITVCTFMPTTFAMAFNVSIDISYTFEGSRTGFLGAG